MPEQDKSNRKGNANGSGRERPLHICIAYYNLTRRRRRAFVITETELKLIAAAAKMGLSRRPKNG